MRRILLVVCVLSLMLSFSACVGHSVDKLSDEYAIKYSDDLQKPEYNARDYVNLNDGYANMTVCVSEKHYITDSEVDNMVQTYILDGIGYTKKQNHKVNIDSIVEVSYTGSVEGVLDDALASSGHKTLDMTDTTVPVEFIDALKTMNTGETKSVSVKFDETYPVEKYQNKTVVYELTLHYVLYMPEITDDNVRMASQGTISSVDDLKIAVRKNGDRYYADKHQTEISNAVLKELKNNIEINNIPDSLIEWYVHSIMHDAYVQSQNFKMSYAEYVHQTTSMTLSAFEQSLRDEAQDALYMEVVLQAIADAENLTITDKIYQKYASKLAALNKFDSIEAMEKAVPESVIHENVFLEMVMGWLIDHATVTYSAIEESTGE